jgi:uncharacterized integral membrane protein
MARDRPESLPPGEDKPTAQYPPAKAVAGVLLVGLIVALAIANSKRVTIDFIIFTTHTRLFVAIIVSALLGAGAVAAISWRRSRRAS